MRKAGRACSGIYWSMRYIDMVYSENNSVKIEDLKIAIYADGANIEKMKQMSQLSYIKGFTTNPTLMKKAGVADYVSFAKEALAEIPDRR